MKHRHFAIVGLGLCLASGTAIAQQTPPPPERGHMEYRTFRVMPFGGRWWTNPDLQKKLNLSTDQQKQMDDIFQQNRISLIRMNAALQEQEATLDPLMSADEPDEAKITAQIDKVAEARANLEKQNARMLLGMRRVLTPEQWKQVQALGPVTMPGRKTDMLFFKQPGPGGPGGPPEIRVMPEPPQE
jgi:Spy/CpxP family protein refolding chaperone